MILGVYFGACLDGTNEVFNTSVDLSAGKYRAIGPFALLRSLNNMPAGILSKIWGLRGPCMSINTACASGLHSIGEAYRMSKWSLHV